MQRPVDVGTLEVVVSQLKQPPTIPTLNPSTLLDPQFSLSVGGDCSEGWSEDTVSRLVGCWGWEERWDLDHPSIHEKGWRKRSR